MISQKNGVKMKYISKTALLFIILFTMLFITNDNFSDRLQAQEFTNTVVSLNGKIISTNKEIPANLKVTLMDKDGKKVASSNTMETKGEYTYFVTGLKPNTKYYAILEGKGFFTKEVEYEVPNTDKYLELSKDFVVEPMEIGTQILVKVVPFDKGKSKLRNGSDYIFQDYVSILQNNPRARFDIVAYPDNNIDKDYNLTLTDERAKSIKEYFITSGIKEFRVSSKGNELTDPKQPPPFEKAAKGKKYIGSLYLVVSTN